MRFGDVCALLAKLFGYTPSDVGRLTPYQAAMLMRHEGGGATAGSGGGQGWRYDPRWPGVKVATRKRGR